MDKKIVKWRNVRKKFAVYADLESIDRQKLPECNEFVDYIERKNLFIYNGFVDYINF